MQATLLRVYVFAKQYSIVLALVQVLCSHTDQVISHTLTGYGGPEVSEADYDSLKCLRKELSLVPRVIACVVQILAGRVQNWTLRIEVSSNRQAIAQQQRPIFSKF
jgi:hypothetical protein